jgi:acid phosphatase
MIRRILTTFLFAAITVNSFAGTPDRDTHERLNALLWVQTSAEFKILTASMYRDAFAKIKKLADRIKNGEKIPSAALEQKGTNDKNLPLAIIVDIDETILDNSPMTGRMVNERTNYQQSIWNEWAKAKKADFIPGAEEFLKNILGENIEVFYVTNRKQPVEADTIVDLLPIKVNGDKVLTVGETGKGETEPWVSEKTLRRAYVAKTHWIIGLVGDDLGDFIKDMKIMNPEERVKESQKHLDRFGEQWCFLQPKSSTYATSHYA